MDPSVTLLETTRKDRKMHTNLERERDREQERERERGERLYLL